MAPYATVPDVVAYTPNLLDGETTFSASTIPTDIQVLQFLDIGTDIINAHFAARGFQAPTDTTITGWAWLVQLNTYYGVAQAEKVRTTAIVSPGERTRSKQFETEFWDGIKQIDTMDLTYMGLTPTTATNRARIYAGGVSTTDKESVTDNDDNTKPRFSKNQFATWVND